MDAFGGLARQKPAPDGLLPSECMEEQDLRSFRIPSLSQVRSRHVWRLGFLVGSNSG